MDQPAQQAQSRPIRLQFLISTQNRIGFRVNPVPGLGRLMASKAIGLVIRRSIVVPVIRFEQRPTPAITPQGILSEATLAVLDHDEPLLQTVGRMAYATTGGVISSF